MSGEVWNYHPVFHKTEHKGKSRYETFPWDHGHKHCFGNSSLQISGTIYSALSGSEMERLAKPVCEPENAPLPITHDPQQNKTDRGNAETATGNPVQPALIPYCRYPCL